MKIGPEVFTKEVEDFVIAEIKKILLVRLLLLLLKAFYNIFL